MSCTVALSNSPIFSPSFASSPYRYEHNPYSSRPSPSHCSSPSSMAFSAALVSSFSCEDAPSSHVFPSPMMLKRKRPACLSIPSVSLGFGLGVPAATPRGSAVNAAPVEEVKEGFYSVYCKRGKKRAVIEDRYSAVVNIQADPKQAFFGVFDGHGGCQASEFAAQNMEKNIMEEVAKRENDEDENTLEEAVKHGYLKTDSEFLKQDLRGGSCCVTALIRNGKFVVSNAGDCRAVLSRGGTAETLTTDHRPSREDEKDRIEAKGGYIDCYHGVWRIQGSLAVSRGIGDRNLKQWVIAEPETKVFRIQPDHEFLILASDGLWEKVADQEAIDIARRLCVETSKPDALAACKKLVAISASRGSVDDISVMLIQLNNYM